MYDKNIEQEYYKICEDRGYFEIDGNKNIQKDDKKFCIMMPPPNITGVLHIGHALTFTLQDIITRYKRMDGYKVLYQPGLDHAGIATQNIVEKQLLSKGIHKEDIGRKEFINKTWQWKEQNSEKILKQMKSLGITPAWSRLRFTMDEGFVNAVKKAFVDLYNKKLIFRANKMINWCTHDGALSDIEVEHKINKGKLYYIRYFLKNSDKYLVVATTRPETYFGDTALMINPNDERYKSFIGSKVILPRTNKEITIIADEHVDMGFGTGIVKVTPAHDINDYEVGLRHNLDFIVIFDEKGILNEHCLEFNGIERLKAKQLIVDKLQNEGFIEKIEDYENQVGYCYRCDNIVEPYISKQWFVSKDIAQASIKKVKNKEIQFFPNNWINSFNAWMSELRDWCISRQLWWGHRIPVFYCECGYEFASINEPKKCQKCGNENISQDENVLDTWFSSGLWAIGTLGWGNDEYNKDKYDNNDLKEFYPNSLLITGFDILFFWVARMMFQSTNIFDELPFKKVYLHALIKDEFGKKMSKSLGNVIDPLKIINDYSADILRFTLSILAVQGRDIRFSEDKILQIRNFTNKLYNACQYLLLNEKKFEDLNNIQIKSELGKYIYSRFNLCIKELRTNLSNYRFNDASNILYRFFWDEFCDWGIELSKAEKTSIKELGSIFKEALKLLHPFMPFITEYLYHRLNDTTLQNSTSIMISEFPKFSNQNLKIEQDFNLIIEAIISIRRAKTLVELGNLKIKQAYIKLNDTKNEYIINNFMHFIKILAKVENINITKENLTHSSTDISDNLSTFIPLENIDLDNVINRLKNQKIKIENQKIKFENILKNDNFIKNAPENIIIQNKDILENLQNQLKKINEELKSLEKEIY